MCTRCRHDLDQSLMTEEVKEEFNVIFQWLYDVNLIHTPSIASSDSYHMLSQSLNNLVAEEKREHLKRFLEEVKCFNPIPSTNSFENLQPSSKKRFCRQSTNIFKSLLDMMSPHDNIDFVWHTIAENSKGTSSSNSALDKNLRL
ncbi:unnamed protein product, partial [Rotaria magnacalcarata]